MGLGLIGQCMIIYKPHIAALTHIATNLIFLITMPIIYVRLNATKEANRHNVEKLDNFIVINECADQYTNVDIDSIDLELDYALKYAGVIQKWLYVVTFLFFFEIFIICVVPLSIMFCCKSMIQDEDSDYERCDEKQDNTTVDPEAKFLEGNQVQ